MKKGLFIAALVFMVIATAIAAMAHENVYIDHNGTTWTISSNQELYGHHYNITTFTLSKNATINVTRYLNTTYGGWLTINATIIDIQGNITGDGKGYPGGAGAGGGGGGEGVNNINSNGGQGGTNWAGTAGCTHSETSCTDERGAGGERSTTDTGGEGGRRAGTLGSGSILRIINGQIYYTTSTQGEGGGHFSNGGAGDAGENAPYVREASIYPNATIGGGGTGGAAGGGGGGRYAYNDGGGGGGGSGAGQDGGAYVILEARQKITINGTINMRPGQETCTERNGADGESADNADPGRGGAGGSSSGSGNCQAGTGGNGGAGEANSWRGGDGGSGGYGAAGMIVARAPNVTITSSGILNVTDAIGGGSIKILYRTLLSNSGTHSGYSSYLATNYNNAPSITSIQITPIPATQANSLTCNYTANDADSDPYSVTINWTVNGNTSSFHTATLGVGNYSNGQRIQCLAYANDTISSGSWSYSANLTLNDASPPTINSATASTTTPTSQDPVVFTANVTDTGSSISSTACKFQLQKDDYNPGTGLGNPFNQTTNTLTGTQLVSVTINMANFGTGTLSWQYAFCSDDSGNQATGNVTATITISAVSSNSSTGGGGGGGTATDTTSSGARETQTVCGLEIIKPATTQKTATLYCIPGAKIRATDFTAYNTIGQASQFQFKTGREDCTIEPRDALVPGNERVNFKLTGCICPDHNIENFAIQVITGTCQAPINVTMVPTLTASLGDPIGLALWVGSFIFAVIFLSALVFYISQRMRR